MYWMAYLNMAEKAGNFSFILQCVSRPAHSLVQSQFSTERDVEIPLSISSILKHFIVQLMHINYKVLILLK